MKRPLLAPAWLPMAAWMAVIFIGSSFPGNNIPGPLSRASVALHIIEYALLYAAIYHAVSAGRERSVRHSIAAAFTVCILYGVSDEIHQAYVPGRHPDAMDLATDAVGAIIGAGVLHWWKRNKLV